MSGSKNAMNKESSEEETLDLSNIGMEEVALEDGQNFIASINETKYIVLSFKN